MKLERARPDFKSAIPSIIEMLLYAFLIREMWCLWSDPTPADFPRLQTLAILMGFEFLLVHSALFIHVTPRKISILFLLPIYGIVALALNTGAENNLILYLYLGVIITRLRFLFGDHTKAQKSRAVKTSIVSFFIYFAAIAIIAVGETSLPKGGLTAKFLESGNYLDSLEVYGIFTEQPHLPLLMGMFYFSALILFELYLVFIRPPRLENPSVSSGE
jgi:hypothetical protein